VKKFHKSRSLIILATCVTACHSYADKIILPPAHFDSPDGKFSFKIEDHDRHYNFIVKNLNTRGVTSFIDEFNPIFTVKWTSDSKTVFIVAHYARGKLLDMLHYGGEKWALKRIAPPEKREFESEILNWKFVDGTVHLFFKVIIDNKTSPEAYKCDFDFDPSTGAISKYKKSLISSKAYGSTKSALAPD
jgi:hypothetical protein